MANCQNVQKGEVMKDRKNKQAKKALSQDANPRSSEAMAEFCRIIAEQLANSRHGCGM
jgi:hypothetical protein